MTRVWRAVTAAVVLSSAWAHAQELKTEDEKTVYALGLAIGKSVAGFNLSKAEFEILKKGLTAEATGAKPLVSLDVYGPKLEGFAAQRSSSQSQAYLAKAEKEKGAQKLPSGLLYTELKAGTGASPSSTDTVKVNYRGTLTSGAEFDSSYKRGQPAEFPLNGVIPCWTEGVQKMKVGGKARLVCPSEIAYGAQGQPPTIPGGAALTFEIELLEISKAKAAEPSRPSLLPH